MTTLFVPGEGWGNSNGTGGGGGGGTEDTSDGMRRTGQTAKGSTNTNILILNNADHSLGDSVTHNNADYSSLGSIFTINRDGTYMIVLNSASTDGSSIQIMRNAAGTVSNTFSNSNVLNISSSVANAFVPIPGLAYLTAGTKIWLHHNGTLPVYNDALMTLSIYRVSGGGRNGDQGPQGDKGDKGDPGDVSLNTTQTLTNKTLTNFRETAQTLTDGATINWDMDNGGFANVTLGNNRTIAAPTNLKTGGHYTLLVYQDGTGSRTLTWNAVFVWPGGTAPTLKTAAGAVDVFTFTCDGTNLYGTHENALPTSAAMPFKKVKNVPSGNTTGTTFTKNIYLNTDDGSIGSGFTVTKSTANGTYFTATKSGVAFVKAVISIQSGFTLYLEKNTTIANGGGTYNVDIQDSSGIVKTNHFFTVNTGDVIWLSTNGTSSNVTASADAYFQIAGPF